MRFALGEWHISSSRGAGTRISFTIPESQRMGV